MMLQQIETDKYICGWVPGVSSESKTVIINSIENDRPTKMPALEGRVAVRRTHCSDLGPVVIKEYRRGGILGKLLGNTHLRFGLGRGAREINFLGMVGASGVAVPSVVGFVETRGFIYKAWAVMSEVPGAVSLAEAAKKDSEHVDRFLDQAAVEIIKLIKARVFHIDLHPGNVLVSSTGDVYLIDFDKAEIFKGSLKELRDLYLCRWRRAVIKHNLPHFLGERMSLNLRQNNVWEEEKSK